METSCKIIVSYYSPINTSEETDITIYHGTPLAWHITKHNVQIIVRDMNAQIGKDENNKFSLHNLLNRNGEYLADFSLKNSLSCLNTKFQKREGKL